MKIFTFILIFVAVTLSIGCSKKPAESTQSPLQTNGSSGVWPGTGVGTAASVSKWDKWAKVNKLKVSEWATVKVGISGDVVCNKKQMSLAEFAAECERLKKVGGGVLIFVDTAGHSTTTKAQAEAVQKIVTAGVPMYPVQVSNID